MIPRAKKIPRLRKLPIYLPLIIMIVVIIVVKLASWLSLSKFWVCLRKKISIIANKNNYLIFQLQKSMSLWL